MEEPIVNDRLAADEVVDTEVTSPIVKVSDSKFGEISSSSRSSVRVKSERWLEYREKSGHDNVEQGIQAFYSVPLVV